MVNLERLWIMYDTSVFVQKWLETHPTVNRRLYHQHQLQLSFTASVYTTKCKSGKEQGMAFCQNNGGGGRVRKCLSQPPLICCLSQMISCVSSGVNCHTDCGTMRCSCKKHGIACSIVCGNCKGSGCMNSTPNEDDSDDDIEQ